MESGLLKKMQRSEKTLVMVAFALVFCGFLYYVFFMMKDAGEGIASVETPAAEDSYQEYKDYVSNTNKGIKSLLESEQLKQIKVYDSFPAYVQGEPKGNPFAKSF